MRGGKFCLNRQNLSRSIIPSRAKSPSAERGEFALSGTNAALVPPAPTIKQTLNKRMPANGSQNAKNTAERNSNKPTNPNHTTIVVCGKAFLSGEYGVMAGYPALILPILTCQCHLSWHYDSPEISTKGNWHPLDEKWQSLVQPWLTAQKRMQTLWVDDSDFFDDNGNKLGLGSSSALAMCLAHYCHDQSEPSTQWQTIMLARKLHLSLQNGRGSGAEMPAIAYQKPCVARLTKETGILVWRPLGSNQKNKLYWVVIANLQPAPTSRFLQAYERARERENARLLTLTMALGELSNVIIHHIEAGEMSDAVARIDDWDDNLLRLSDVMGLPLISSEHRYLRQLCTRYHGGVALKVSGAGGGDISIACSADLAELESFVRDVEAAGRYQIASRGEI